MSANNMPRCKTCKHWLNATDYGWGDCSVIPRRTDLLDIDYEPGGLNGKYPVSTSADFGCVEHEERGK